MYLINKESILSMLTKLLFIIFVVIFIIEGLQKPLWLDELLTIQIIKDDSALEIIKKLYLGADTNAPLYFIILKIYTLLLGFSELSLRIFSIVCSLLALIINYKIISHYNRDKEIILIILWFLFISHSFSSYLLVEVRTYSLYYLLSSLFIFAYIIMDKKKNKILSFLVISILCIYVHYYSFFLLLSVLLYELISLRRLYVLLTMFVSFLTFLPWLPALVNQYQIGSDIVYQEVPHYMNYYGQYLFLFGNGGILFVLLVTIIKFNKISTARNEIKLALILIFIPFSNLILSQVSLSVHNDRYFVFSLIGIVILFSALLKGNNSKKIKFAFVMLLSIISINRGYNYWNNINEKTEKLNRMEALEKYNLPIVCESPHLQYPLNYYSNKKNFYFITDSISSFASGNIKNAPFDYCLFNNYRKYYDSLNIKSFDEFTSQYHKFILINEDDRQLFEQRIINDSSYSIEKLQKNIFIIRKKNV